MLQFFKFCAVHHFAECWGLRRIIAENFKIHFIRFWEIFQKILKINRKLLKIISKNFEENFGIFWEILWTFSIIFPKIFRIKSFRKTSKIISENFWKLPEIFLQVSRNIAEILGFVLKIFKNISGKFNNYCGEFWELFHNILRNISENFEKYFGKVWKLIEKF